MIAPVSRQRWTRSDLWIPLGLLLAGVVLPLVANTIAGSLEIPRNDDWLYRRIAIDVLQTGRVAMDGVAAPNLLGQIALTEPILWLSNGQSWAFTVAGIVFAVGAVVGAFAMARQVLPAGRSAVAVLALILFPGYLAYATSYMSDVPALAAEFLAIALGAVAVARQPIRLRWLVVACLAASLAFSIRQPALAAAAAILVAAFCAEPRNPRVWAIAVGTVGLSVGIELFRLSLPGQLPESARDILIARRIPPAIVSIAFVTLPAAIIGAASSARRWRRRDVAIGTCFGLGLVGIQVAEWVWLGDFPDALLQSIMTQWGAPGRYELTGGRPLLIPQTFWTVVNLVALGAVVVVPAAVAGLAGLQLRTRGRTVAGLVRSTGSPIGLMVVYTLALAAGMTAFGLLWFVYDRYLWPIVTPLAIVLMVDPLSGQAQPSGRRRSIRVGVAAYCLLLAAFAIPFMANSAAFDAARWRAGERLVAAGVSPGSIDAGYEWTGSHTTVPPDTLSSAVTQPWYRSWWPNIPVCGLVSSTDVHPPGSRLISAEHYALYLVGGPLEDLFIYQLSGVGCEDPGGVQ